MIYRVIKGKKVLFGEVNKIDSVGDGLQLIEKRVSIKLDKRNLYNLALSDKGLRFRVREFDSEQEFLDRHYGLHGRTAENFPDGLYIIWEDGIEYPKDIKLYVAGERIHEDWWYGDNENNYEYLKTHYNGQPFLPLYLKDINKFTLNIDRDLAYSLNMQITKNDPNNPGGPLILYDFNAEHGPSPFLNDVFNQDQTTLTNLGGPNYEYSYTINFNNKKNDNLITKFYLTFWYDDPPTQTFGEHYCKAILPCINMKEDDEWPLLDFYCGQIMPEDDTFDGEFVCIEDENRDEELINHILKDNFNKLTHYQEDPDVQQITHKIKDIGNIVFLAPDIKQLISIIDAGLNTIESEFVATPVKLIDEKDNSELDYILYRSIESVDHHSIREHDYIFKFN